jgi:uncharacterized membrane protein
MGYDGLFVDSLLLLLSVAGWLLTVCWLIIVTVAVCWLIIVTDGMLVDNRY